MRAVPLGAGGGVMASTADTLATLLEEAANHGRENVPGRVIVNHIDGRICAFVELGPGQVDQFFREPVGDALLLRESRGERCVAIEERFNAALDDYIFRATGPQRVRESAYR